MTSMRRRISAATVLVAALALLGGLVGNAQEVGTLQITQTAEPQEFFEKGSNVPDEETAEIRLRINAPELPDRLPTDLMLIVDRSASFPVDQATRAANRLINGLDANDRVGLVSFATDATVDAPLTPASEAARVRSALDDLQAEGKTGLGAGIAVAADELDFAGRDEAERVAVVFTDGRSNHRRDPVEAAQTASANDVTLYSVGLGDFPNRSLLTDVAEATGGQFFETFTDSIAQTIFEGSLSADTPFARDIEVAVTLNDEFTFEGALRNPPAETFRHPDGATELRWRRSELAQDSTWDLRYEVSADEDGTFSLYNSTADVRYTNVQGREVEDELPNLNLRVKPAPPSATADFGFEPDNPDRFDTISFSDRSSVERGGEIAQWDWDFGDGTTSTRRNPTHQYEEDGTYRVSLTVTTTAGVEDTATQTVQVSTEPQVVNADFTYRPDDPTRFNTLRFHDRSTLRPRGQIERWRWNFGDGTISTERNPTHQYDSDGTYRVTLRVTTDEGNEDTASETITVDTPDQEIDVDFSVSPEEPTRFDEVEFTDESDVEPRGRITDWAWDFGDGETSTRQHPTHQYDEDGTYRVTLTVTTDEDNEATARQTIRVDTPEQEIDPAFSFSPDEPTRFDEVEFTDESEVEQRGRITDWAWDFDDGETSTEQHPTHQFDEDGTYRVTLTVTTDEDNEASVTHTIEVETPPQVVEPDFSFTPSNPTRIDEVKFTDETTVTPRGEASEWHWDFGDGATSTEQNPSHRYDEDGRYRVTLEVTTDEGNEATVTKTLAVNTPPIKVVRTIDTYTPTNQTLPTRTFRVSLDVQANVTVHGLGIDENVPDGWSVTPVENSTAQLRSDDLQWLFSETFEPGDTRTIVYDVTAPEFDNPGTFQLDGMASSASPELNVAVEGDTDVQIVPGFSIPIVIAHWDTSNDMLDLQAFPNHTVNKNQILQAIAWWQEGNNVPNTQDSAGNRQAIDFAMIQQLVAYWLTDTSVFEDLPDVDLNDNDKNNDDDSGSDDEEDNGNADDEDADDEGEDDEDDSA